MWLVEIALGACPTGYLVAGVTYGQRLADLCLATPASSLLLKQTVNGTYALTFTSRYPSLAERTSRT